MNDVIHSIQQDDIEIIEKCHVIHKDDKIALLSITYDKYCVDGDIKLSSGGDGYNDNFSLVAYPEISTVIFSQGWKLFSIDQDKREIRIALIDKDYEWDGRLEAAGRK